ncbi:ABC transporter ATP-binding protein [Plantactinospora sp. S1510]|uniref:ABC transporter ATP-binding protein n=1 Tax=Plantactinospora alkalitolerans TaxID=2789879 RepID=A0ABS0GST4_9ACTN|nr:ABC transporter ATP-binding protein [Plantactinospora alkalitolerans]MBF9129260.1 ABC transporter ATP-binding protein [Plantactinospora alkalitolerans]
MSGGPAGDSAIVVSDLRKSYRGRPAVAGIDLVIPRGEVFSLLGPNGAGKTTTVEILEGHRRRDSGDVRVLGVDPALGRAAWKARIGIVLQRSDDLTQAGALTVRDWARAMAACFPNSRDPDEVIELVGLADRRNARAAHLSGGQRRRLDVALGIIGRPELLFLDEPTTGFDPEARRRFWDLIADLARSGTTILLTTHYLEEAEHLADRVAVIVDGRIMEVGPPQTLGGRATAAATVRWLSPDGPRSVQTCTPAALVTDLAARFGQDVPGLAVERPSLEEVYLRMIGAPA